MASAKKPFTCAVCRCSKVRCSGGRPCSRCTSKGLLCLDPGPRQRNRGPGAWQVKSNCYGVEPPSVDCPIANATADAFEGLYEAGTVDRQSVIWTLQLWQLIGDCWGMDHSRGLLRQLSTAVNATEGELCDLSFPHPIFGAPPVSQAPGSNKDDSTGPSFDLHPFLASLETGDGAAVLLHAAELKTGTAKILTNPIFTEAFFSANDAVNQMNDERSLIWMIYASIVAKGDQEKFLEGHTPLIFASGVRAYRTDVSVHTKAGNTVSAHIEIRTHRDPERQLTATVLRVVPAEGLAPFVDMKDSQDTAWTAVEIRLQRAIKKKYSCLLIQNRMLGEEGWSIQDFFSQKAQASSATNSGSQSSNTASTTATTTRKGRSERRSSESRSSVISESRSSDDESTVQEPPEKKVKVEVKVKLQPDEDEKPSTTIKPAVFSMDCLPSSAPASVQSGEVVMPSLYTTTGAPLEMFLPPYFMYNNTQQPQQECSPHQPLLLGGSNGSFVSQPSSLSIDNTTTAATTTSSSFYYDLNQQPAQASSVVSSFTQPTTTIPQPAVIFPPFHDFAPSLPGDEGSYAASSLPGEGSVGNEVEDSLLELMLFFGEDGGEDLLLEEIASTPSSQPPTPYHNYHGGGLEGCAKAPSMQQGGGAGEGPMLNTSYFFPSEDVPCLT